MRHRAKKREYALADVCGDKHHFIGDHHRHQCGVGSELTNPELPETAEAMECDGVGVRGERPNSNASAVGAECSAGGTRTEHHRGGAAIRIWILSVSVRQSTGILR